MLSVVAYGFFARSAHETLEPLLGLPEGRAAYAATMQRVARTIVLSDLPLVLIVGIASLVLARFSVHPLIAARAREERFAADAAHELRTPLATIAAVAQAARGGDEGAQARALARITEVALAASGLLADLMALMRDAPDETRLHEPVDLAALAGTIAHEARATCGAVVLRIELPAAGAYVIGETRALAQLIKNLVENAVRHARTHVTISVANEPRAIVLAVEDDGPGVAPADRERIFERFFKADANATGSGLGLAIARHIARRNGGTLQLEANARFCARFPRAQM